MLKQFNMNKLIFDDPVYDDEGVEVTSGEGWVAVETQEEIDNICASLTGGGKVWLENGNIACSGRAPSDVHSWNGSGWVIDSEKQSLKMQNEQEKLISNVKNYLDLKAQEFGYDSLVSAISYADEPAVPKYQLEGQAFRRWRSEVWDYVHQSLKDITSLESLSELNNHLFESLPKLIID